MICSFDDIYEPVPPEVDQEKKRQEFEEAVKHIHDWLCKYGDPYTTVAVMQDRATVHHLNNIVHVWLLCRP